SELNKPVEIDGHELLIRASIGVVCKTGLESEDSLTVGTILQDADKAVYQAKKSGRNQYVISS
ncbi:MAG: diguanylate cyclase (GGDEF)-like protein, partial [Pseudohongiellaceae bacterium]